MWHIRTPDHVEERADQLLQIWGEEGYWHIVDRETGELLAAVSHPTDFQALLKTRPDWKPHQKLILSILETISAGLAATPRPTTNQIENVSLNLTTACNLHCATCYVPTGDRSAQKLDAAKAITFLEKLGSRLSPNATMSLLGGEPFLHLSGVMALAEWAKKKGLTCTVSTNGTVPLKGVAREIRRLHLRVQVSIDGARAQTNDALRGAGTFERAMRTARDLIAEGVHTTLCMVACQENLEEIGDYLRLARTIGASEVRVIPLKRLGNAKSGGLTPASQLSIVQKVVAEIEREPGLETLCQSDLYSILKSMVREGSHRCTCGSGTQTLLLQADGTVYPCINTTLTQAKLGTIDQGTTTILRKGHEWSTSLSVDNAGHPCHFCAVKRWCLAGCPGETIQREGSLRACHWNCSDLNAAIIHMMWHSGGRRTPDAAVRTRI